MSGGSGMALEVVVRGIGLAGPGLAGWVGAGGGAVALRHPDAAWTRAATVVPAPARLPANERRRAGTVIKAALAVADEAVAMAAADPARLATVFTSSTGDPANCHALCEALAAPERLVSPTRFTNSVHNAPAGYWHIATQSMCTSTSLAAFDASFGAGLLEAAVMCRASGQPVLLVSCDVPYPQPLHALRPLADAMAVALLLAPPGGAGGTPMAATGSIAHLALELPAQPEAATPCRHAGLEQLRGEIPAARALPLLAAMAAGAAARIVLEAADGCSLAVTMRWPMPQGSSDAASA